MNRIRRRSLLLLALPVFPRLVAQIAQCPSCGRELRPEDARCRGCGTALRPEPAPAPATPEESVPAAPAETSDTAAPLDLAPASGDAADARAAFAANQPRLSALFARNALALHGLSRVKKPELAQEMKALARRAEEGTGNRPVPCSVCKGSGQRQELVLTMKGEGKKMHGPGLVCPVCKGAKTVPGIPSEEALRSEQAQAAIQYTARQEGKGLVLQQRGWLPAELDLATLAPRSLARFRQAVAGGCNQCLSIGRLSCGECSGTGITPCPDTDCVFGKVVCPTCDGKKMESVEVGAQTALRPCRTCTARGIATCETCAGRGQLVCARCEGQKGRLCRDCEGTGQPRECTRCHGEGLQPCSRCKATGEYRGKPCESCLGRREILCTSCEGAGRRQT